MILKEGYLLCARLSLHLLPLLLNPTSSFIPNENDIDQGLGQTEEKVNAKDRVPPECPPFLPFLTFT